jgi:hypothetical protein
MVIFICSLNFPPDSRDEYATRARRLGIEPQGVLK